jgi:hypothetical protein
VKILIMGTDVGSMWPTESTGAVDQMVERFLRSWMRSWDRERILLLLVTIPFRIECYTMG